MRTLLCLALLAAPGARAAAAEPPQLSLEEAYKKEFAFLVAQERQLEKRLGELGRLHQRDENKLQGELASLEAQLLSLDDRLLRAQKDARKAQQALESATAQGQRMSSTIERGKTTLEDHAIDVVLDDDAPMATRLELLFTSTLEALAAFSKVTRETGEFFDTTGTKVSGEILGVGRIASFAVNPEAAGALAPAGAGRLKLWPDTGVDAARALAAGHTPQTLTMFLYESVRGDAAESKDQSILEHIAAGGAIAWVILLLGLGGLLFAAIRVIILLRAGRGNDRALEATLAPLVTKGELLAAAAHAEATKGSVARASARVLRALSQGERAVDEIAAESLIVEGRGIKRFETAILVVAAVSPLLGLLGTVTGMISTFDVITEFGTGDPKLLSGGISTALITTELGLIVAIPMLLLGNLLKGWGEGVESAVERSALRLIALRSGERTVAFRARDAA